MAAANMSAWKRQNSSPLLVDVQLSDGTSIKGNVMIQREYTLLDVMNSPDPFIEFECTMNGWMAIGKATIKTIRPFKMPKADQLERKLRAMEQSEAFQVLKIEKTATTDEIRDAYLSMAQVYHPDRFCGVELPPEIAEFLNAMMRRINTAYSELKMLDVERAA